MRILASLILAAGLLAGSAWAAPVPADKMAYVGNWQGKDMQLSLSKEGKVEYKRGRPNDQVNLSIDLQRFKGNHFEAGVSFVTTTFVVSKPPHREGGKWKMTVDGVELTRDE
ncbi:hypothetical protein LK542_20080 [Massilia sp. IC2-477]|uniref:hypothetical protein n=1 Tax=Massilia sp. IC2-477 TaxID=2887198 RepID=UPI001D0F73AE|nr:hypothetical protein [Massilia sp. IC2-477]MCC2957922.1 hypothetical protein [Massilia sp. IC2-477]